MHAERVDVPEALLQLKPSAVLESVSMSKLARTGTAVLRQILDTGQAVTVEIQGQGAMVTLSQRQYDEMVAVIHRLGEVKTENDFSEVLSRQFDELVAGMNQAGAASAMESALFADPGSLNANYHPGATEADHEVDDEGGR